MDLKTLKEIGKAVLFVLIGMFMYPMLVFLDWGWNRWTAMWGRSKMDSVLFVLAAPIMGYCWVIARLFAVRWQKMLTG